MPTGRMFGTHRIRLFASFYSSRVFAVFEFCSFYVKLLSKEYLPYYILTLI